LVADYINPSTVIPPVKNNCNREINYPQVISGSSAAINEILAAIPMFSGVPDSTVLYATSPEVDFQLQIQGGGHQTFYQRSDELATKFQI